MARIEVHPQSDGLWGWVKTGEGADGAESEAFDTRKDAVEDALLERTNEAVVLMRADGSVHGELYNAAPQGSGEPIRADILAAATRDANPQGDEA